MFILCAALLIRLIGAWTWHQAVLDSGRLFRLGDSHSYWILAGELAHGRPYQYGSADARAFRAPLYPIALAPFTLFADERLGILCARMFGCILGTLTVALIMRLASICAFEFPSIRNRERAVLAAGVSAALYPAAIGMSITVLSEAVFCPIMVGALICGLRSEGITYRSEAAATKSNVKWAIASGALSALAILARPSWLLFIPFAGIITLLMFNKRRERCMRLVVMGLACAVVMSPWWVRNAILIGKFVPTTLQVGASLYDGLHAGASGGSDENMVFVDRFVAELRAEDRAAIEQASTSSSTAEAENTKSSAQPDGNNSPQKPQATQLTQDLARTFEYRLNQRMSAAAWHWVLENPAGAARLSLIKFSKTWSLWPTAGDFGSTPVRIALTLSCLIVLIGAVWGSRKIVRRCARLVTLLWLPAVYFTLLHMIFVGSIRYREPAVLVLTALAGVAAVRNTTESEQNSSES
ncbi:MAG: hypothetical protein U0892_12550 [Pirellulales bacterium]